MALKVYRDRMSQPSRVVLLFCMINGIEFEEMQIDVINNKHLTPGYKAINPMRQLPAIVNGGFKLFESHAILIYISCAFPDIATHWYPTDILERSNIHSVLDWHHTNLRRVGLVFNTIVEPLKGLPPNPEAAIDGEKLLVKSLSKLQNFWLEDGRFLLLSKKDRDQILSPYKKVVQWIEDTKGTTTPHFDEGHGVLFNVQKRIHEQTQSG
nr:glutathione S-transferase T1-like [Tanacetum cinerariifolium]